MDDEEFLAQFQRILPRIRLSSGESVSDSIDDRAELRELVEQNSAQIAQVAHSLDRVVDTMIGPKVVDGLGREMHDLDGTPRRDERRGLVARLDEQDQKAEENTTKLNAISEKLSNGGIKVKVSKGLIAYATVIGAAITAIGAVIAASILR